MAESVSCLFRLITTIYLYKRLLSHNNLISKNHFQNCLVLPLFYAITVITSIHFGFLDNIICIFLFFLCTLILYNIKYDISLTATIISHAIFYILNYLCTMVTLFIFSPFYYYNIKLSYPLLAFTMGLLALGFSFLLTKLKYFRKFAKSLAVTKFKNLSFSLCLLILILKTLDTYYINKNQYNYTSIVLLDIYLPFATILLAFLLFTWWRKQITKSYIKKLRKLEVQSLYDELAEKEAQIKKLEKDNNSLSRIIHKDNKLIPAMEHAVTEFLSNSNIYDSESLKQYGTDLTKQLREMMCNRQGILNSYEYDNHILKLTGHVSLDAILVYMQKKAEAKHIVFECRHSAENIEYLLSKISEEDLSHLLSDLLENAIISMTEMKSGRLQVTFGKLQKEAYIAVADTGCAFELDTLHSFGIKQHTTHENSGGSGIGLMDIWNLKKKYRATIQIQEYEKNTNTFTKKILFSFNSKNHYVIQSFRHAEISNTQTRGDLYVIPMDTKITNEGKKDERNNENLNS